MQSAAPIHPQSTKKKKTTKILPPECHWNREALLKGKYYPSKQKELIKKNTNCLKTNVNIFMHFLQTGISFFCAWDLRDISRGSPINSSEPCFFPGSPPSSSSSSSPHKYREGALHTQTFLGLEWPGVFPPPAPQAPPDSTFIRFPCLGFLWLAYFPCLSIKMNAFIDPPRSPSSLEFFSAASSTSTAINLDTLSCSV